MNESVSNTYVSAHDPLCPWRRAEESDGPERWLTGTAVCECDLIAMVREDMLATCIAAVEAAPAWTDIPFESPDNWREGQPKDYLGYKPIIAALRALQTP